MFKVLFTNCMSLESCLRRVAGETGPNWTKQQGANRMALLALRKQASVLPTGYQFPFCFEIWLALVVRAI